MPIVELEQFKENAEENFYKPVFSSFKYLENDYGFEVKGSAVSCETSIIYLLGEISVGVFHVFPEPPCLILKKLISGKTINERIVRKAYGKSAKDALAIMKKNRDTVDVDEWLSKFRAGDFNGLIVDIVYGYAGLVKNNIEKIIKGDFELSFAD